jgi:quercetin dioxygenase-like cupin family protein
MSPAKPAPLVVPADGGEALWFLGTLAIIRVSGEQTSGRYAIFEALLPKDAAPPLHSHPQDETFVILDGELDVWVGEKQQRCSSGSIALAPGGCPHTFLVRSETARVLFLSTPAGIEQMVRKLGTSARSRTLPPDDLYPEQALIDAVNKEVGIIIHGPAPTP